MYSIRLSQYCNPDPIMVASNIKTTKEAGEMIDHFLHEGFSAMGIEPEDIMSISVVKEAMQLPCMIDPQEFWSRENKSLSSSPDDIMISDGVKELIESVKKIYTVRCSYESGV